MFIPKKPAGFSFQHLAPAMAIAVQYKRIVFLLVLVLCQNRADAQLKIGDNPTTIKAASLLEMESGNKGFVPPRVGLTALNNYAPLAADLLEGTVVYNTNITLPGGPGVYIWKGAAWAKIQADDLGNHTATQNLDLSNKLLVGNGGSSGLAISNSGNVGIGIANPTARLHVNGELKVTGGSSPQVINQLIDNFYEVSGTGPLGLGQSFTMPANATITEIDVYVFMSDVSAGTFALYQGAPGAGTPLITQPVAYNPTGVTKIILTTPIVISTAGTYSFSTGSNKRFKISMSNTYAGGVMYWGTTANANSDMTFAVLYDLDGQTLYTSPAGNVGMGTTAPTQKLDIAGNIQISGIGFGLKFADGSTQTTAATTAPSVTASNGLTKTATDITLGGTLTATTNIPLNSYNLTFSGNGNVGIGNTAPATKLDVTGNGRFTQSGGSLTLAGTGVGSHTYMEFFPNGTGSSRTAWLGYGGNGSTTFTINNLNGTDLVLATPANMYLQTNGANNLFIQGSNGYVGIGNTSPSAMLDVNGTTRLRGLTTAGVVTTDINGNLSSAAASGINPVTASNGLTKTAADITLGGTLSSATTIAQGGNNFMLTGTGNMGIGTSTPQAKLDVNSTFRVGATTSAQQISQTNVVYNIASNGNTYGLGQSFTLLTEATITQIRVRRGPGAAITGNFIISNGAPGGAVLASQSVLYPAVGGDSDYDIVLVTPITVPAGTYSFSTGVSNGTIGFLNSNSNPYTQGNMYDGTVPSTNYDLYFVVYYTTANAAFYVATNGNVGVGSGAPTARLDVNGTTRLRGLTTAGVVTTDANGNLSSAAAASINPATASNGLTKTATDIVLGGALSAPTTIAQGTNNLLFTGTGSLGIGTATPGVKLDVTGQGQFMFAGEGLRLAGTGTGSSTYTGFYPDGATGTRRAYLGYSAANNQNFTLANEYAAGDMTIATGQDLWVRTGGSNRMIVKGNTGNVGIGTISPTTKLQVMASGYGITQTNGTIEVGTYIDGNYGWLGTATNHPLAFFTNDGGVSMLVNTAGNVGIGTENPGARLEVAGQVKITGGTPGTGKILVSDADGLANWQTPATVTASNGLTKNGGDVMLGGTLNTNTTIIQNGSHLTFQGIGTVESPFQVNNAFSFNGIYSGSGFISIGQSFTLPEPATITSITIRNREPTASGNVTLRLFASNGSSPTYTQSVTATLGIITYTLSTPQYMPAGINRFDFLFPSTPNTISTYLINDNYSGGEFYINGLIDNNNSDMYFVINYTKPVPVSVPTLYASANGNVGVGNSNPSQKIEVTGSVYVNRESAGFIADAGGFARVGLMKYSGKAGGIWRTAGQGLEIGRINGSSLTGWPGGFTVDMLVDGNGNVGIGTTSPGTNAKLEIVGGINKNPGSYRYMATSGEGGASGGGTYSLYTSNRIWCGEEINVTSDSRTKTNILSSNPAADLALINKLRVVDYNYKDNVTKGTTLIKGFVAQEVEQIMPNAVTQNKGVVPNIYQNASGLQYDANTKILRLTMPTTTLIQPGDTVKLITEKGEQLVHVLAVQGNQFTIGNWQTNNQWVFVYGTQVNDLRNLDYNKLFSAGISAIQQLSKQNDNLEKENTVIHQEVNLLKAQMKALQERLDTMVKAGSVQ